jgi:ATP-binding cassette subfamily E protein 1
MSGNYTAVIDQDEVTQEVKDIAVKYDPLNRSGDEGFHVTSDGELHIDEDKVMKEHKIVENKIPNDSVRIVELPSESGKLVHQYGKNGFKLYNLPEVPEGEIVGLIGRNGIGKSTILKILSGIQNPNFGDNEEDTSLEEFVGEYAGTRLGEFVKLVASDNADIVYKPQMVSENQVSNTTVESFLSSRDLPISKLEDELELSSIRDSYMEDLSGGERQRVYIAAILLTDADAYFIDEPSSFLDIQQRFNIARLIRNRVLESGTRCIIVEHDMAFLDLVSESVYVVYGSPGNFGVTSKKMTSKSGINSYARGYLPRDDIQIRKDEITFSRIEDRTETFGDTLFEYPSIKKSYDTFELNIQSGEIYESEVLGIVGKNALGKTTFAEILAGKKEADEDIDVNKKVSYKPQYPDSSSDRTVQELFLSITDTTSVKFKNRIYRPLELDSIYENELSNLSGGELQRVSIGVCLSREADVYLIDEPSAYLDIESRANVSSVLRKFARDISKPVMVIDHDLFVIDRIADRVINFEGVSGRNGYANSPQSTKQGMNDFLSEIGTTFRRDRETNRPRANKPDSQLDREQRKEGNYY